MYVYRYVYIYMYIYIFICIYVCMYIYVSTRVCKLPFVRTSTIVTVTSASQLSVAVTTEGVGIAEHSTVIFDGTFVKVGGVMS